MREIPVARLCVFPLRCRGFGGNVVRCRVYSLHFLWLKTDAFVVIKLTCFLQKGTKMMAVTTLRVAVWRLTIFPSR